MERRRSGEQLDGRMACYISTDFDRLATRLQDFFLGFFASFYLKESSNRAPNTRLASDSLKSDKNAVLVTE
jgi:hypothetical protein